MQISFVVTAKPISAFIFATLIVEFLYFLYTKFQASSHLVWLYSLVCVGPGRKPRRPIFSQRDSYNENITAEETIPQMLSGRVIAPFHPNPQQHNEHHCSLNMSRVMKNQSFGFLTRSDTNWAVQPQKMARGLKFRI